jgi:penicillin-binding protein 1A
VQAPARFNPLKETTRERARERAKLVLRLMVEQGRITEAQRRRAEQIGIRPGMLPEFKIQSQAFTEWVTQTWGPRFVKEGETIRFFVTLVPRIQDLAENELHNLVSEGAIPPEYEAAAVMMTGKGEVRAMIGTIDWSQRQFNHAVKADVQPGSTAKLPLLVAACEKGRAPDSRVLDRPITGEWPSNGPLGYRGETTLKEAFASSRNAAAVRLARELGIAGVAAASRRLGIDPGAKPDLDFVLGTFSTNVLAMTAAYGAIANGGYRVEPTGVLAVVDGRGEVRADLIDAAQTRVVPQRCIEPTRSALKAVVQSGTGRGARLLRWEAFGKTGTTTGNADAWFIGWSEGRVLGVWMGRPRGTEGSALAGMGAPADLFRRVSNSVNEAMERRQEKRAKEPPAVASRPPLKGAPGSIRRPEYTSGQGRRATPSAQAGQSSPTVIPLPPPRPWSESLPRLAPGKPGGAS